jgi:hypothetical protein
LVLRYGIEGIGVRLTLPTWKIEGHVADISLPQSRAHLIELCGDDGWEETQTACSNTRIVKSSRWNLNRMNRIGTPKFT